LNHHAFFHNRELLVGFLERFASDAFLHYQKEVIVVRRCGYWIHSIIKDWTVVFDHLAMPHRKLLDMTILLLTTRLKISIVTGDRDWNDLPMNIAVIPDDFLFFDVYLFLTPVTIWQEQIDLVAGLYHWHNIANHDDTVVFGHFSLTDRPLHQILKTTNEQVFRLVSFFSGRDQVLAWTDFNKFGCHSIFQINYD
jgi:hypothetical protein